MKHVSQKFYGHEMTALRSGWYRCDSLNPAMSVGGFAL